MHRAALVLLLVYGGLRVLFELPARQLHLEALNVLTAEWALQWLVALGVPLVREGQILMHAQGFVTEVHQTCTALIPCVLITAAIALHPWAGLPARLAGVLVGVPLLVMVNQLRLVSVVWVGVCAPEYFALVHGWAAPGALIAFGFAYWWAWSHVVAPLRGRSASEPILPTGVERAGNK